MSDRAEMFARQIVSQISEGGSKEDFEADVIDVTFILHEFAANRLIEFLDRIDKHANTIYVREIIGGEVRNVSLLELPNYLAIQHICRMLRTVLEKDEPL